MRLGTSLIVHPTARRLGLAGDTPAEQKTYWSFPSWLQRYQDGKYKNTAPPRDKDGTYDPAIWAEYQADLERNAYGGKIDRDVYATLKDEGDQKYAAHFAPPQDQTTTGRFVRWWSCSNKKAPSGVPNAIAQGACYVRNAGLVVGGFVALGFFFFATKELGD